MARHVEPYHQWSVSSAFSRFGNYRYNTREASYMEPLRCDLRSPHVLHHDREVQRERQIYQVEAVANWIRKLGYLVECGRYRCITWEDADAAGDPRCGGAYRGSNYVIMNIIGADGNYVYGNGPDPVSENDGRISRAPNSSYTRHEEERDLCGHRTILELTRSDGLAPSSA